MPTNFPTSLDSFTAKTNNVDTIDASHVNNLQDATLAIETLLGAGSVRRTSWTPEMSFSTTAPTSVTYASNNSGLYAQFGSLVWFTARLDVGANSGGTGNLTATLPTASRTDSPAHVLTIAARGASGFTVWPAFGTITGASGIVAAFVNYSSTAAAATIVRADVSTSAFELRYTGFYFHA